MTILSTGSRPTPLRFHEFTRIFSMSEPMKIRTAAALLALLVFVGVRLPAATTTFPVDELKPGMVGVGRTVFQGDELQDFKVHILGVFRNVIGTRRNLILAKLEGGPLADTGVIAGMSGSPVYIDGRLVGAVSYSLGQFSKEPTAGITPIAEMVEATAQPAPRGRFHHLGDWRDACDGFLRK